MNELKVLQTVNKYKFCNELIDFFEDDDSIYLVSKYSAKTLRAYVEMRKIENFSEQEACGFLAMIAYSLDKLHSKQIMHRDLRMESVTVKVKSNNRLFLTLSSFDFTFQNKKKNYTVQQSFNVSRSLAPEMKAG